MMATLDAHPAITGWSSESLQILYRHPLTGKMTMYVPDFYIVYKDRNGVEHREVVEIKPADECFGFKGKVSKLKEARQIVNMAKWQAAKVFCETRGMQFRILTEREMFGNRKK